MKEPEKNTTMIDYLLGRASEEETTRMDEACFTDDGFRELVNSVEADLIDQYVSGEMDADARELFRLHFLATPSGCEKVAFAEALKEFVDTRRSAGNFGGQPAAAASWMRLLRGPVFAAIAVVLILLVGAGIWWDAGGLGGVENEVAELAPQASDEAVEDGALKGDATLVVPDTNLNPPAVPAASPEFKETAPKSPERPRPAAKPTKPSAGIVAIVLMPLTRGTSDIQTVNLGPDTGKIRIRARLEFNDHAKYRATLTDPSDGSTLWSSGMVAARPVKGGEYLNIEIPARSLKPRIYSLAIFGEGPGGGENVGDYPFRVAR